MEDKVKQAKKRVASIFFALTRENCKDLVWEERLIGGWQVESVRHQRKEKMIGYVSEDGYYSVDIVSHSERHVCTLDSGYITSPGGVVESSAEVMSSDKQAN